MWSEEKSKIARGCGAKHICNSKCQKNEGSGHFLKLGCGKIARRCGAKHDCKSKCTKHMRFGTLLEVEM